MQLPGVKEPERVRKLLQGTASLEFWETYENSQVFPFLEQANAKIKEIRDAEELLNKEEQVDVAVEEKVEKEAQQEQVSEIDTAKAGEEEELIEMLKDKQDTTELGNTDYVKNYPLFAKLNPSTNQQGQLMPGPIVGMAHYRDTAQINEYLSLQQVKSLFPRDLKFLWAIKPVKWDKTESYF